MRSRPLLLSAVTRLVCGVFTCLALVGACAPADRSDAAAAVGGETTAASAQEATALPPGAAEARARLDASPRHGEWVVVSAPGGDSVRAWLVYPEREDPAPVVVVVHEIFGLTAWVRAVTDQLAADGFVAIAPDLLSGRDVPAAEDGDPEREAAVAEVRALDPDQVHRRIRAVAQWTMALPAATDRYGVVGYCWGGAVSFAHAARVPQLGAAVVYYGSSPDSAALNGVRAPVLGLYAGDDARVNATVPPAEAVLVRLGRTFETRTYEGAGHGFLRQQDGREGANRTASEQSWPETIRWFRTHLDPGSEGRGP